MAHQMLLRRLFGANVASLTFEAGEIVEDATNNRLVIHDGKTVGGWPVARLDEAVGSKGTAVAVASAATLNTKQGSVTSQALAAATTFTLTLTNSLIQANSIVMVNATDSAALGVALLSKAVTAGQVVIAVSMAALTGTVQIDFQVL